MTNEALILNIERYCKLRGEKKTNACAEAGVGKSFISDLRRGQSPAIEKVAKLAAYFGCSVSDLVGDSAEAAADPREQAFLDLVRQMDEAQQDMMYKFLKSMVEDAK